LIELIRQAQEAIARVEPHIEPLEQYQARLNEIEDNLRDQALQAG
jgi:hypothetical protein